jgi:hypothetical protein
MIPNGGFEQARADDPAAALGCRPWERGYVLDPEVVRSGVASARCRNESPDEHRGLTWVVDLNQDVPLPFTATAWSRAERVTGTQGGDYSLYLDLEYTDGTPLYGRIDPFRTGTHDWEQATVTVFPDKPVRRVSVHGIFRRLTGTAWFDDFSLTTRKVDGGLRLFDGVPVASDREGLWTDPGQGTMVLIRDVRAGSDFLAPFPGTLDELGPDRFVQTVEPLDLNMSVESSVAADGTTRVSLRLEDLAGRDRALTLYVVRSVDARNGTWWDDPRRSRPVPETGECLHTLNVGAGLGGRASRYPFGCVTTRAAGHAVGLPLDRGRLARFAYNTDRQALYAAVDLGLPAPPEGGAGAVATVDVLFFGFDPEWGFRAALETYYRLCPESFTKRVEREGIWMPFADIATVPGFRDFGFQFQEGAPNPGFDEEHGIYSFPYVEPMSHWLALAPDTPRTLDAAMARLGELARQGDPQAVAATRSAFHHPDAQPWCTVVDAPWCDGALFFLNPAPGLGPGSQFEHEMRSVRTAFAQARTQTPGWRAWDAGYDRVTVELPDGEHATALRMARVRGDAGRGATQTVILAQDNPQPFTASVWTRPEGVTGDRDSDYALYLDLIHRDGTQQYGVVAEAPTGDGDWTRLVRRVEPAKPVQAVHVHLLFRGDHAGTAWFRDAELRGDGADRNLLRNPSFREDAVTGVDLDGVYIDSFEMAADTRNYRRDHLEAPLDYPAVFDDHARVCLLGYFQTLAFATRLGDDLHAQGKLLFANALPARFPWAAAVMDIMGTETNWAPDGRYRPDSDEDMLFRRAMSGARPYALLLNTVYDRFEPQWVEWYFARCTAYGVFPGFFSHNAADDPYWARPDLYERDRPLFRRCIPVIQRLAAAGWEPVTLARARDDRVWVERFGRPADGTVFLTVFNPAEENQATVELQLDAALQTSGFDLNADDRTFGLGPQAVRVVELRRRTTLEPAR